MLGRFENHVSSKNMEPLQTQTIFCRRWGNFVVERFPGMCNAIYVFRQWQGSVVVNYLVTILTSWDNFPNSQVAEGWCCGERPLCTVYHRPHYVGRRNLKTRWRTITRKSQITMSVFPHFLHIILIPRKEKENDISCRCERQNPHFSTDFH